MPDAWRLCLGTFLAMPVRPPRRVDRRTAGWAMVLAPATTVPALLVWAALVAMVVHGLLPPFVAAALAVAAPVLLARAMHLDGLADTADGLSAGYDRERSLEVMRRSDVGPSGVAALVLVLLVDVACLAALLRTVPGAVLAGTALVASRLAPALASCGRPAARPGGLGHSVAESVHPAALVVTVAVVMLLGAVAAWLAHLPSYAAVLVPLAALLSAEAVTRRATRRLGGVTGDVVGAAIETALAAALVTATLLAAV